MEPDSKRTTFPGGMPNTDSPTPSSPTRPLSPSQVISLPQPPKSPRSCSPPHASSLSLFPQTTRRPLSPQQLPASPTAAVVRPSATHSRCTSLQGVSKMPPIREDANSIFADVNTAAHRRSRNSSYQYGQDYITAYDRVGLMASPTPRPQSRTSVHSTSGPARSLRRSASVKSMKSWRSLQSTARGSSGAASSHRKQGSNGTAEDSDDHGMSREPDRDLEHGPVSEPESELEKAVFTETMIKRPCWRRWKRFAVILLVVLGLAGLALGIIFGMRS